VYKEERFGYLHFSLSVIEQIVQKLKCAIFLRGHRTLSYRVANRQKMTTITPFSNKNINIVQKYKEKGKNRSCEINLSDWKRKPSC